MLRLIMFVMGLWFLMASVAQHAGWFGPPNMLEAIYYLIFAAIMLR